MRTIVLSFRSIVFSSLILALALAAAQHARAQGLGYEGPTGVFVTPLASVAASPANGLGKPAVAYHFLAGGNVVGDFSTVSVTEGFAKRFEVGYTSEIHAGSDNLANGSGGLPWQFNFSIVHGKANLLPENYGKRNWVPAISVGAIYRFDDNEAGDGNNDSALSSGSQTNNNADFYVVGTKVITQISKKVPVLISGGVRGTNAELWGLGGNAPNYQARAFGAAALIFTGPSKSTIIVGSEVSQQPKQILVDKTLTLPASILDVPTSTVFAARFIPSSKHKFNIDAGVLHAGEGGNNPVLNLRYRAAFGISYSF